MADALKAKGNQAFQAGNHEEAIKHFSDAIDLDPSNHVLYSNRSAAEASLGRFEDALQDANKVVELKPDWPKGYSRVGAAQSGLRNWDEAVQAYRRGLQLDPNNAQMQESLEEAEAAKAGASGGPAGGLGGMFSSPDFFAKLTTNPQTRAYLGQPDFMAMMQDVGRNPQNMSKYLSDPRFQNALQVALGISMMTGDQFKQSNGFGGEEGADSAAPEQPTSTSEAKRDEPMPEPEPEEDEEVRSKKQKMVEALQEKELGNAAYKAKRFDEAIQHYDKAWELNNEDISFLTNRAAVQLEKGDYDACIKDCDTAVERGRELRTDYKTIARALTRKGNAQVKKGDLEGAITTYQKALTEHRNPDTLKRLNETEKKLKEAKEAEYINMDLASQEKDKGNEAFKEQRYPDAVKHYTEALARGPPATNPEAYKLYSNRAACFTKLGAWSDGLKDAEQCIALAPTFGKGYSRKGHLQFFMKEYDKALATYEEGLKQDPGNQELKEGMQRCIEAINKLTRGEATEEELKERQAKGMADPDVQNILMDPVMRQVLNDMQQDPRAAQKHLKHPDIAAKLQKLVNAGIVQMR
ncbi:hypothetical protein WJX72_004113 [[Myrmecia] bisecta]|uniref:STI1 domain-containing protein n=1 Tax=[Myrmecia] bisecta TaxID=41462 RepID=A0AAW1QQR4_9CHLO